MSPVDLGAMQQCETSQAFGCNQLACYNHHHQEAENDVWRAGLSMNRNSLPRSPRMDLSTSLTWNSTQDSILSNVVMKKQPCVVHAFHSRCCQPAPLLDLDSATAASVESSDVVSKSLECQSSLVNPPISCVKLSRAAGCMQFHPRMRSPGTVIGCWLPGALHAARHIRLGMLETQGPPHDDHQHLRRSL